MTQGIAASQFVNVIPGVLSAGGQAVDLNGLILSESGRVPVGTVLPFPTLDSVEAYFGASTDEANMAASYFLGYDNSLQKPGSLLFAQYPSSAVKAYLRGGSMAGVTLTALKATTPGTITILIGGTSWVSGSIDLSAATSFSNAASLIQTALAANDGSATGSIAPAVGITAGTTTISGTTMTVVTMSSGAIVPDAEVTGGSVTAGTTVVRQLTGTAGGAGTYEVSISQTRTAFAATATNTDAGVFTAASVLVGFFGVGQVLVGTGVTAGTAITAELGGTGGLGTYVVTPSQTASSTTITGGATVVTYDSTSGGFVITGGTPGAADGVIAFPTTSAFATAVKITLATGAVLSQGAGAEDSTTVDAFMNSILLQSQNWAAFTTAFEPDDDTEVAFASWTNDEADNYAYGMWTTDVVDTSADDSTTAWGRIKEAGYSGTFPVYAPTNGNLMGAFVLSFGACLDFGALNGRATAAFKSQTGLSADVVDTAIAAQLSANGLSYYGKVSSRNPNNHFTFLANGYVSGPFLWYDSYLDQIWLNDNIVVTLMTLLTTVGSIPYNASGYTMIHNVISEGPVSEALNYGAIRAGVPLSATQKAYVNNASGRNVDKVIEEVGWYLLIQPASAVVRQARTSPPMTLFYTDGQSIQQISLQSLEVA